jgi:glycosyltransferase involved in cell wall biosynthesis
MPKKILLIEPYFTGSHKEWAAGLVRHSRHDICLLTLEGRYWKWRMHGGAVSLAKKFHHSDFNPDLILATDMLDLTTFLALTRKTTSSIPTAVYFHENQITYPWSPDDRDVSNARDHHYGFINFASALAAQKVFFNSKYHRDSFLAALPKFLNHFPDHKELDSVNRIAKKSSVLYVGLELDRLKDLKTPSKNKKKAPVILWNHRWEYDKNPEDFFKVLTSMDRSGLDFQVVILGENFQKKPGIFEEAVDTPGDKIIHFGFCPDFTDYSHWLFCSDILPVTSKQDFFGISIVEAAFCGVLPLLPRRLTYPELFPEDKFPDIFYSDLKDLALKMTAAIGGKAKTKSMQRELREHILKFSWKKLIKSYDKALEKLTDPARDLA